MRGESAAPASAAVERFGRYEMVHKLASGGMGEVFLARSIGVAGFQKHVVIKKLLPHLVEQAQFVDGLIREAKLLVRLDHPNIVQVLDLGVEGTDYFMAMEYVHGYNLATIIHYCAQNQVVIPATACGYIALQVLAGLEYAHALTGPDGVTRNVIHRDVSPQNVMISTEGRVKLTDFGIAKVVNEAEGEFTQSLKGKFRYMAPEVVDGGRIDHRYDLFAAGILLFESLCRRHLFSGSNDLNILDQVRKAHVPPIARYHPGVARELVLVVEKALTKDPQARYQGAGEFASALRAALQPATDAEAGADLRRFIGDLYARSDFPINKPKLPDLNDDASTTRSIVLRSQLLVAGRGAPPAPRSRALIGVIIALVLATSGVVGFLLLRDDTIASPPEKPPVIIVQPKTPDARVATVRPDAARAAVAPRPDARPVGVKKSGPGPFSLGRAQAAFRKRGSEFVRCFHQHAPGEEVRLKLITSIAADGKATSVVLDPGSLAASPFGQCALKVASSIRYPPHNKPTINFAQPLTLKK
jgi:serine/threonine protein kinase